MRSSSRSSSSKCASKCRILNSPAARHGKLIVLSAPSGAGKTTLVRRLLEREPNLRFSISFTTRPPRKTETSGEDYFFVDEAQFEAMIAAGEFLEHARVFDHWYGTSREHVRALIESGQTVLLEIDWQGARQVRRAAPHALTVFILPPSVPALEQRLRRRASDSDAVIARRLRDALDDMSHWDEFDFVIVNDDLDTATDELARIVCGEPGSTRSDTPATIAKVKEVFGTAES